MSANKVLFVILFFIPLAALAVYEIYYASDRYESTAAIFITEEQSNQSPLDLSLLGFTSVVSSRDSFVIREFAGSLDMMLLLDNELGLKNHYSDPQYDYFSRLETDATQEEFRDHYENRVKIEFDDETQLLHFSVQSYDRKLSQNILELILDQSQKFIDQLNEEITSSQQKFFDKEIKLSEENLIQEKRRLLDFQKRNNILTTEGFSETILATIGSLEQILAQKQSELNARLKVLNKNAPQLQNLKREVEALQNQIQQERKRLAGQDVGSMSELDSEFRDIKLQLEFKTAIYTANLNALETARLEAARRLKFLTVVSYPSVAEESEYPDRVYVIVTGGIIFLVIYFVLSLIVSIIREHS